MSPGDGKGPPEFRIILRVSFGLTKTGPDRYSVGAQLKPCFYSPWQVRFLVRSCRLLPSVSLPSLTTVRRGSKCWLCHVADGDLSLRVHRVFFITVGKGSTHRGDLRFSVCTSGTSVIDFLSPLLIWLRPKVVVSSEFGYLSLPAASFTEVFHSPSRLGRTSLKSCYQSFAESFYGLN